MAKKKGKKRDIVKLALGTGSALGGGYLLLPLLGVSLGPLVPPLAAGVAGGLALVHGGMALRESLMK